ncbi:MAG: hypothetical protein RLZ84_1657 [Actinomycetota bacterium]
MALRAFFCSSDDETPVTHMCERCPHFLTVDDPLVPIESSFGLHVRQVATGVRFAVALTPAFITREDARQESLALFGRSIFDECRPEQVLAHVVRARRSLCTGVFLGPDDLLADTCSASAEFLGPAETDPACSSEDFFPCDTNIESDFFVARATATFQFGKFTDDIVCQPPLGDLTKLLVIVRDDHEVGHVRSSAWRPQLQQHVEPRLLP